MLIILLLLAGVCGVDQGLFPIFQDPDDALFDLLVCFLVAGHQHVVFQGTVLRLSFLFGEAGIGVLELLVFFVKALTLGILGDVGLPQAPVEGYEACRLGSENRVPLVQPLQLTGQGSEGLGGRCRPLIVGGRFQLRKYDEYGAFCLVLAELAPSHTCVRS